MPEGPSIVILREAAEPFIGRKIIDVSSNSKSIDTDRLLGQKIIAIRCWGKHFLICFKDFLVRIHLLMFGSYLVNEKNDRTPRLGLQFKKGEINFYTSSVRLLEGTADDHYDWSADVMNDAWDPKAAAKKLLQKPSMLICDALLEQEIFSGVGNIIKNEILYRVRVHPESTVGAIPAEKRRRLIKEARIYSFEFLTWKKEHKLKEHWLAHTKKTCTRCKLPFILKHTGSKKRRSFFCTNCQILYN